MDKKTKRFEDWVFESFSDSENYDKISYSLKRLRKIFIADVPGFEKFSFEIQKSLITTSYMVSMGGQRGVLNKMSMFNKKSPDDNIKKYDIEYGFEKPTYIQVINKDKGNIMIIENL